jgi:hypothetical protein
VFRKPFVELYLVVLNFVKAADTRTHFYLLFLCCERPLPGWTRTLLYHNFSLNIMLTSFVGFNVDRIRFCAPSSRFGGSDTWFVTSSQNIDVSCTNIAYFY